MAKLFSFSCIAGEKHRNRAEFADPTTSSRSMSLAIFLKISWPYSFLLLSGQGEESEKVIRRGNRIQKLIKSLSCLLEEGKEEEEEEREMVIGFPTDVRHVGHIGWDGSSSSSSSSNNNNNKNDMDMKRSCRANGPELLSLDSLSLKQFEAAMATITVAAHRRWGVWLGQWSNFHLILLCTRSCSSLWEKE